MTSRLRAKRNLKTLGEERPLMPLVLLVAALFLGLFSNSTSIGGVTQVMSIALLMLAGFSVRSGGVFRFKKLNFIQTLLVFMGLLSLLSASVRSVFDSVDLLYTLLYSVLFVLVVVFVGLFFCVYSIEEILNGAAWSFVLMIAVALIANGDTYAAALAMGADDRWSLRYMPFDMHPNLMGFMFGGGVIVLLFGALNSTLLSLRMLFAGFAILSLSFVFAASARASLVAIAFSSLCVFVARLPKLNVRFWIGLGVLGLALSFVAILNFSSVYDYVTEVLELESDSRGFDSGATGRTELWARGINLIFSDFLLFLIGGGLRSASPELIGFSTESSYITIALESGLFLALIWGGCIVFLLGRAGIRFYRSGDAADGCVLAIVSFVFVQSFFNRYMLAVGNSVSILYLIVTIYLAGRHGGKALIKH